MDLPQDKLKLRITNLALERAQILARSVGPYECIGFLAGEADSDVIDTVILARGQRVTPTSVVIDGQYVLDAGREIERENKKGKGWWHSHGNMPTFHSFIDDDNTRELLSQLATSHHIYLEQELVPQTMQENGTLLFSDGYELFEMSFGDRVTAEKFRAAQFRICRKVPITLAYSLVVNARNDAPHAELHTRHWCPTCQTVKIEKYTVPVEVVSTLDEIELQKEIAEKVYFNLGPPARKKTIQSPRLKQLLSKTVFRPLLQGGGIS